MYDRSGRPLLATAVDELLDATSAIELTGDPVHIRSNLDNGVERLPVRRRVRHRRLGAERPRHRPRRRALTPVRSRRARRQGRTRGPSGPSPTQEATRAGKTPAQLVRGPASDKRDPLDLVGLAVREGPVARAARRRRRRRQERERREQQARPRPRLGRTRPARSRPARRQGRTRGPSGPSPTQEATRAGKTPTQTCPRPRLGQTRPARSRSGLAVREGPVARAARRRRRRRQERERRQHRLSEAPPRTNETR